MHLAISSSSHEDPATVPPVLVVDDLAEQRAATAALLANQGYPALTERDGDAVLRRVRTQPVRLVVSELYVPCSEGRCTVTCLKQDRGRLPQLRVLVHTRHTTEADVAWALDAGCDGIVPKTASPDVLLREVRRLDALARPRARETPPLARRPSDGTDRQVEIADRHRTRAGRCRRWEARLVSARRLEHIVSKDAVVLSDNSLVRWVVTEREAGHVPGAQGPRCLVFMSESTVRRIWTYPATWRLLPADALLALSEGR